MARMSRIVGVVALVVLLILAFGAGWLTGTLGYGSEVDVASLTDLEREFTEQMRGARMVGRFTLDGREDQPGRRDEYFIESVEKVGDDRWRFTARIGYSGSDVSVPLVVTMRWIGDTPMMMLTDFEVPTMGTFTVRLFYHGDRYAGTWQNERGIGGHMFGRISRSGIRDQGSGIGTGSDEATTRAASRQAATKRGASFAHAGRARRAVEKP